MGSSLKDYRDDPFSISGKRNSLPIDFRMANRAAYEARYFDKTAGIGGARYSFIALILTLSKLEQ